MFVVRKNKNLSSPIFLKNRAGFTIIELLVVVAIIGLLISIILISLRNQKEKAEDVRIESSLSQLRKFIAVTYSEEDSYTFVCQDGDKIGKGAKEEKTNTLNEDIPTFKMIDDDIKQLVGSSPKCHDTEDAYCISSVLHSGDTYCIDSTGYIGKDLSTCDDSAVCH